MSEDVLYIIYILWEICSVAKMCEQNYNGLQRVL